jgi:hypothetical protein
MHYLSQALRIRSAEQFWKPTRIFRRWQRKQATRMRAVLRESTLFTVFSPPALVLPLTVGLSSAMRQLSNYFNCRNGRERYLWSIAQRHRTIPKRTVRAEPKS